MMKVLAICVVASIVTINCEAWQRKKIAKDIAYEVALKKLSVFAKDKLLFESEHNALTVKETFETNQATLLLLELKSNDKDCLIDFRVVNIPKSQGAVRVSDEFGNCSSRIEAEMEGESLVMEFAPAKASDKEDDDVDSTYRYDVKTNEVRMTKESALPDSPLDAEP